MATIHTARIIVTRAGGFPQEVELQQGNTFAVADGVYTVTKLTSDGATLRFEREGFAPQDVTLAGEKPHTLKIDKADVATLTLAGVSQKDAPDAPR